MDLKEWGKSIVEADKEKGWGPADLVPPIVHMLIVTEVAEATEAYRNHEREYWEDEKGKPEGEAVELADALIRILGYAGWKGWNMDEIVSKKMAYNATRPYRHGGKKV